MTGLVEVAVTLDAIRTDCGTQVREGLDEAHVEEFVALYGDGHTIEQIVVMTDGSGVFWCVDGAHRLEAMKRLGWQGTQAKILRGSLEDARLAAAAMNKNGLTRTAGDKKRAILMADTAARKLGKKMGVRELARHVGVAHSFVVKTLGKHEVVSGDHQRGVNEGRSPRKSADQALWIRVDGMLLADPGRSSASIAQDADCDVGVVYRRRKELGLPGSDPKRQKSENPVRERVREAIKRRPEANNAQIAREVGVHDDTVRRTREAMASSATSQPTAPASVKSETPPSAPTRRGGDVREGVEVMTKRPSNVLHLVVPPASAPPVPTPVDIEKAIESAMLAAGSPSARAALRDRIVAFMAQSFTYEEAAS